MSYDKVSIRDWPEIRKLEIPLSELCPISGDWGELGVPNLTRMSLTKYYWMMQNARVTAFAVPEMLWENRNRGWDKIILPPSPPRLGLSKGISNIYLKVAIEMFSKLRFSGFKKFATRSVLGSSNSRRYHWDLKFLIAT